MRWLWIAALLSVDASAVADGYSTQFDFATTVNIGGPAKHYKPEWDGDVPMPKGNPWACHKNAVKLNGGVSSKLQTGSLAFYSGSFTCTKGELFASTTAMCDAGKESSMGGHFCVGDGKSDPLCLFVSCQTQ